MIVEASNTGGSVQAAPVPTPPTPPPISTCTADPAPAHSAAPRQALINVSVAERADGARHLGLELRLSTLHVATAAELAALPSFAALFAQVHCLPPLSPRKGVIMKALLSPLAPRPD